MNKALRVITLSVVLSLIGLSLPASALTFTISGDQYTLTPTWMCGTEVASISGTHDSGDDDDTGQTLYFNVCADSGCATTSSASGVAVPPEPGSLSDSVDFGSDAAFMAAFTGQLWWGVFVDGTWSGSLGEITCTSGGGPGPAPTPGEEDPAVKAWRANSSLVDLTDVGAPSSHGTIDLTIGRVHRTELGNGLIEYGYFSSDQYVPLGWEKIDWTGLHYAVPEANPILSVEQLQHALFLAGWNDNYVAAPSPDEPAVSAADEKTMAVPYYGDQAAEGSLEAIRGGVLKRSDLGNGLYEIGLWRDGAYTSLGWVQYDAWGNVISYAVPETNRLLNVGLFQQLMESNPSFQ